MSQIVLESLRQKIQRCLEEKDWKHLELLAKEWIRIDSRNAHGFKWLARASLALGKTERAQYAYNRVLDFEANNEEAKRFFTDHPVLNKNAAQDNATNSSNERVNTAPYQLNRDEKNKLARAEYDAGMAYEACQLFRQAAERYTESCQWRPTKEAALGVGRAYFRARKHAEAMKYLRDRLYQNPEWIEGRVLLGRILFDMGQIQSAQKEWQLVLNQDPENKEAFRYLRGLYIHEKSL